VDGRGAAATVGRGMVEATGATVRRGAVAIGMREAAVTTVGLGATTALWRAEKVVWVAADLRGRADGRGRGAAFAGRDTCLITLAEGAATTARVAALAEVWEEIVGNM
jgi:hypothetical protein